MKVCCFRYFSGHCKNLSLVKWSKTCTDVRTAGLTQLFLLLVNDLTALWLFPGCWSETVASLRSFLNVFHVGNVLKQTCMLWTRTWKISPLNSFNSVGQTGNDYLINAANDCCFPSCRNRNGSFSQFSFSWINLLTVKLIMSCHSYVTPCPALLYFMKLTGLKMMHLVLSWLSRSLTADWPRPSEYKNKPKLKSVLWAFNLALLWNKRRDWSPLWLSRLLTLFMQLLTWTGCCRCIKLHFSREIRHTVISMVNKWMWTLESMCACRRYVCVRDLYKWMVYIMSEYVSLVCFQLCERWIMTAGGLFRSSACCDSTLSSHSNVITIL